MPPKRRVGRDEDSGSDTDEVNRTVITSPNITMSEEMFQSLISNITRSQAEANRALIENMLESNREHHTPSPRSETQDHSQRSGNFAKCTARFNGALKNADELEAFIDAIEIYRDCTNVSDEHALRGLPMLLTGEAAVWWQGVKSSVSSWTDALQRLRGMYGVPRPAYKIFREIFATEQSSERADVFICKVRALLSKLPYAMNEVMKLDIVYGLLDRRIRKRVTRDAVDGLEQLITKVRLVEESLAEVSTSHLSKTSSINPSSTASDRSSTNLSVNPAIVAGNSPNSTKPTVRSTTDPRSSDAKRSDSEGLHKRVRPKCAYCKLFGHTIDNCRNKENNSNKVVSSVSNESNSQLRCYGCGQLGVVRSKCENCKVANSTSKSDFCSARITDSDESLPMLEIQVVDRTGVAILDTGATHSIAGPMLYDLLLDAGVEFRETSRDIRLADGSQQQCAALECKTDVILRGHVIPTSFLVLPNAPTRTLLGRDFIKNASILLDLPQSSWSFNDEPKRWYPFITRFELPTSSDTNLKKVNASNLALRDEEGMKLRLDQRAQLNSLMLRNAEVDLPSRSPKDVRENQLKDPRVRKIIEGLESAYDPFRGRSWSTRGFMMSDGVLYRYEPEDCEKETARLVVPEHERKEVLAKYHNAPTAGHYGVRRTLNRVKYKYYWSGMRRFIVTYVKKCVDCQRMKPRFMPRQDGPYRVKDAASDTIYVLERVGDGEILGRYHVSQLTPFVGDVQPPVNEKRKRGRPKRYLV